MSTHSSSRRTTIRVTLVVAVIAAVTVVLVTRKDDTATVAAASIFKTTTVERGTLGTSESVDGSVALSDVTTVLHRIEGQTSSSIGRTSSTGGNSAPGVPGPSRAVTGCDAPGTTSPGTTSPDTTVPDTSSPDTTVPDTTLPGGPGGGGSGGPVTTTPGGGSVPCVTTTSAARPNGSGQTGAGGGTGSTGSSSSAARVTQVVTSVIADGASVVPGTVLYSVEGSPVVALTGVLPAWRTLSTSSTDGADIEQLERSLVALGYDPNGTIIIDQHFDSATAAVVKAWQAGYGVTVTGKVTLGSVVFLPSAATVAGVNVAIGDAVGDGDEILSLATTSQQVIIDVPDGAEKYLVPGLVVKIGTVSGTVTLLRSNDSSGSVVVQAIITPETPLDGASNGSSVKVKITVVDNQNVLLVPAEALVSRLDGSYAVQVARADGTSTFVTVDLLGVSGNKAGIRGDGIATGTQVLQPV